jgi:hypothetical protein
MEIKTQKETKVKTKIKTIDEYREKLINLSKDWPKHLSTKKIMKQEGIRDFGMSTLPANALVQDIVFGVIDLVKTYDIDSSETEQLILYELEQYADTYKFPELLEWDVECSISDYLSTKKRFIGESDK